jgi:hypothetical protein
MILAPHQRKTSSGIAPSQNLPRAISPLVCHEYTYPCPRSLTRWTQVSSPSLRNVWPAPTPAARQRKQFSVMRRQFMSLLSFGTWGGDAGVFILHINPERRSLSFYDSYRNFLMACTALMEQSACPAYLPLLEGPPAPGVRHLQGWIEDAWSQGPCRVHRTFLLLLNRVTGYDKEGSDQLKHQLVGTRKWIGTGGSLFTSGSRNHEC